MKVIATHLTTIDSRPDDLVEKSSQIFRKMQRFFDDLFVWLSIFSYGRKLFFQLMIIFV